MNDDLRQENQRLAVQVLEMEQLTRSSSEDVVLQMILSQQMVAPLQIRISLAHGGPPPSGHLGDPRVPIALSPTSTASDRCGAPKRPPHSSSSRDIGTTLEEVQAAIIGAPTRLLNSGDKAGSETPVIAYLRGRVQCVKAIPMAGHIFLNHSVLLVDF